MTAEIKQQVPLAADLPHGRLLALDVGERRIGIAVCDELGLLGRPLEVLTRASRQDDFERLATIARSQGVLGVVVGYPLNDDGSAGPQARQTARFARRLAQMLPLPVLLWDERLSTFEAQAQLGGRQAAAGLDAVAAAVILQSYLDARRPAKVGRADL